MCEYNARENKCKSANKYWGSLDNVSKKTCEQKDPCGTKLASAKPMFKSHDNGSVSLRMPDFIRNLPDPPMRTGGNRHRHRTSKRKLRRRLTRRRR